ncbi:hypothetical protein JT358_05625 [Micrococcales bacterium 31B]|nr:hypothetical protein [Micrococcales bacterium 31B]
MNSPAATPAPVGPPFTERLAAQLAAQGWPRASARIFAALLAGPDAGYTATSLASQLGVGASAISNGARMLRDLELVQVTRGNDRQVTYHVQPDVWLRAIVHRDASLRALEDLLREGQTEAGDASAAARLADTADFFAFLREHLPTLVEQWRATRASEKMP